MNREGMKRIWQLWAHFWATDRSLSVLLLMLIIFGLALPAMNIGVSGPSILLDVIFTLLLISGIVAVWSESRWVFRVVATIALGALLSRWLARFMSAGAFASWDAAADMIALASLALVVLAKVLRPGTITSQRIQGAVAVYLLFGLIWANAYEWTESVHPNAFTGAGTTGASWTYYSFVTLTTMGYGDITPKHPVARSLATAEALTGQLYIAILISRLVALEVASRKNS
jgi:Ion channel